MLRHWRSKSVQNESPIQNLWIYGNHLLDHIELLQYVDHVRLVKLVSRKRFNNPIKKKSLLHGNDFKLRRSQTVNGIFHFFHHFSMFIECVRLPWIFPEQFVCYFCWCFVLNCQTHWIDTCYLLMKICVESWLLLLMSIVSVKILDHKCDSLTHHSIHKRTVIFQFFLPLATYFIRIFDFLFRFILFFSIHSTPKFSFSCFKAVNR